MAHHVETMSSQIAHLSCETKNNDDETASPTIFNTTCVFDMIILTVGCCLVTKTAVAMVAPVRRHFVVAADDVFLVAIGLYLY
jgi:hypothetical protein